MITNGNLVPSVLLAGTSIGPEEERGCESEKAREA